MSPLSVGSLFSGIGGIDLGLERTGGFRTAWFSEVDPYASRVLARHWPDVPNLGDVRTIQGDAPRVDVLAGGFPCQPVSLAGKRLGSFDERWLWPEFARLVGLLRPRIVLVENVPGLASKGLRDVLSDMSALRYDAEWQIVSAASVGAPHLRERLFVVAYPVADARNPERGQVDTAGRGMAGPNDGLLQWEEAPGWPGVGRASLADADGLGRLRWAGHVAEADGRAEPEDGGADGPDPDGGTLEPWRLGWRAPQAGGGGNWATEPDVGRVAHGVPSRMDRLRCLGNGVVPQVAEFVGSLILEAVLEGRL